eukprot:12933990-Prorocentrum_lima.AAC.1
MAAQATTIAEAKFAAEEIWQQRQGKQTRGSGGKIHCRTKGWTRPRCRAVEHGGVEHIVRASCGQT